jgi:hypothetical protein
MLLFATIFGSVSLMALLDQGWRRGQIGANWLRNDVLHHEYALLRSLYNGFPLWKPPFKQYLMQNGKIQGFCTKRPARFGAL